MQRRLRLNLQRPQPATAHAKSRNESSKKKAAERATVARPWLLKPWYVVWDTVLGRCLCAVSDVHYWYFDSHCAFCSSGCIRPSPVMWALIRYLPHSDTNSGIPPREVACVHAQQAAVCFYTRRGRQPTSNRTTQRIDMQGQVNSKYIQVPHQRRSEGAAIQHAGRRFNLFDNPCLWLANDVRSRLVSAPVQPGCGIRLYRR